MRYGRAYEKLYARSYERTTMEGGRGSFIHVEVHLGGLTTRAAKRPEAAERGVLKQQTQLGRTWDSGSIRQNLFGLKV